MQVRCTKRIYRGQWGRGGGWKFIELTPCFPSASPRADVLSGSFYWPPPNRSNLSRVTFSVRTIPPVPSLLSFLLSPVRSKTFLTGCFQVRPAEPTELTFFPPSPSFYPPNFYRFALHERQSFSLYSIDTCICVYIYRREEEALLLCCILRLIALEGEGKKN